MSRADIASQPRRCRRGSTPLARPEDRKVSSAVFDARINAAARANGMSIAALAAHAPIDARPEILATSPCEIPPISGTRDVGAQRALDKASRPRNGSAARMR